MPMHAAQIGALQRLQASCCWSSLSKMFRANGAHTQSAASRRPTDSANLIALILSSSGCYWPGRLLSFNSCFVNIKFSAPYVRGLRRGQPGYVADSGSMLLFACCVSHLANAWAAEFRSPRFDWMM